MPPIQRDLTNLYISESYYRLVQTDPIDDATLLDGTGSLVTYLAISGTLDAFYLKGDGSQITNLNFSGSNLLSSSQQVIDVLRDKTLEVNTLVAQQYVVSSSVYYVTQSWSSGSTIFGNSADDTHQFTGSVFVQGALNVTSGITGSVTTASYIDPLFISASAVQYGFSTPPLYWANIQNIPQNLISASGQRSILGLGVNDSVVFGSVSASTANFDGNVVIDGTLTAKTYVISSSVLDVTTLRESGSTVFGNTSDDTHQFTGSLTISGSVSASSFVGLGDLGTYSSSVDNRLNSLSASSGYIQYVTNSIQNLTGIEVADFDSNVAVTFTAGTLKFIFGTPTLPSSIAASLSGFLTDRFNRVTDAYTINGSWNNGGYSLVSASLYEGTSLLTQVGSGTSLSYSVTTSGSHTYRLEYTASSPLDGSIYQTSTTTTGTVSKSNPASPTLTATPNVQLGYSSNQIEQGATGSISFTSSSANPSNSWNLTSVTTNVSSPYYVTGSATGSTSISITATANYASPTGDNNPDLTTTSTSTTTYTKIRSLRYGASSNSSFTSAQLEDLAAWDTSIGGTIGTIAKGTTTASGQSVTITWTGDKYHYIVFNSSLSNLSNITTSGFGVLGSFSVSTVGQYKVYKTTTLQAGGAGSSITYVLT